MFTTLDISRLRLLRGEATGARVLEFGFWPSGFHGFKIVGFRDQSRGRGWNIEALTIRIGFCGPLYYNHNKEPPK